MRLRRIENGEPAFAAFVSHLAAAGLPVEDLLAEPTRYYALQPRGGDVSAYGGILILQKEALLRSLVVPVQARGKGGGRAMTALLASLAAAEGAERLWLLTTDAEKFFATIGWRATARDEAPEEIRLSRQFASTCPASAVLMCRPAN